jgi:fibronectin type 3 domain-containing protein
LEIASTDNATFHLDDADVQPGHNYTYTVKAENPAGSGALGNSATVHYSVAPSMPLNLIAAQKSDGSIVLTWTEPANDGGLPLIGYHIYRRQSGNDNWVLIATPGPDSLNLTVQDLPVGTQFFRVTSYNENGDGTPSIEAQVDVIEVGGTIDVTLLLLSTIGIVAIAGVVIGLRIRKGRRK